MYEKCSGKGFGFVGPLQVKYDYFLIVQLENYSIITSTVLEYEYGTLAK